MTPQTVDLSLERVTPRVFRLAERIVRNRDEALDITQESLIRACRHCPGPGAPRRFQAYALKAAYHLALNSVRDRRRRESKVEAARAALSGGASGGQSVPFETSRVLELAMADLADRQQEVLRLRFYADLALADIAEALGISEGSVKVHLARGLRQLRRQLDVSRKDG